MGGGLEAHAFRSLCAKGRREWRGGGPTPNPLPAVKKRGGEREREEHKKLVQQR